MSAAVVHRTGARYLDVTIDGRKIGSVTQHRSGDWFYERQGMNFGPFATDIAAAYRLAERHAEATP